MQVGGEDNSTVKEDPDRLPSQPAVDSPPESLVERLRRITLEGGPPHPVINGKPADMARVEGEQDEESVPEPLWNESDEAPSAQTEPAEPLYDDPSSEDDGEGEWITPTNVGQHQARAKGAELIPAKTIPDRALDVACMTSDFAMQNVLLHMGLNLVSSDGKRIDKVKTWVLRCHACFK